jgi:hypothetical protein
MHPFDWWLVGFGARCCALVAAELGTFLLVVPELFNLHRDAADAAVAFLALVALVGGFLWGAQLTREFHRLLSDDES